MEYREHTVADMESALKAGDMDRQALCYMQLADLLVRAGPPSREYSIYLLCWHDGDFYKWDGHEYKRIAQQDVLASIEVTCGHVTYWDNLTPTSIDPTQVLESLKSVTFQADAPEWSRDERFVRFRNARLDLRDMTFADADPRLFNVKVLAAEYDPAAPRPERWMQALEEWWPGDAKKQQLLQEWMGYSLCRSNRFQKMMLLIGPNKGRGGKDTIVRIMKDLLGNDNVFSLRVQDIADKRSLELILERQHLVCSDARFTSQKPTKAIETLLILSGGGDIDLQLMRGRIATVHGDRLKITILTNPVPRIDDETFKGRFVILPFTQSFHDREDWDLYKKLSAELPGILLWAVGGLKRLMGRDRFVQPSLAADLDKRFTISGGGPLADFIAARCEVGPFHERTDLVYAAYVADCTGRGAEALGKQRFGSALKWALPDLDKNNYAFTIEGKSQHKKCYIGLRLRQPHPPHPPVSEK